MSAGFTPGPWVRLTDTICKTNARGPERHLAYLAWDDEQGNADARLIAAAPELYEALRDLTAIWLGELRTTDGREEAALDRALDALAKARGEALRVIAKARGEAL